MKYSFLRVIYLYDLLGKTPPNTRGMGVVMRSRDGFEGMITHLGNCWFWGRNRGCYSAVYISTWYFKISMATKTLSLTHPHWYLVQVLVIAISNDTNQDA